MRAGKYHGVSELYRANQLTVSLVNGIVQLVSNPSFRPTPESYDCTWRRSLVILRQEDVHVHQAFQMVPGCVLRDVCFGRDGRCWAGLGDSVRDRSHAITTDCDSGF